VARVEVAVIARPGTDLDPCLGALAVAGCPAPIVERASFATGLAVARNAALARCGGEVLAFVEDDVAVASGWLRALQEAWEAPGADGVGCVGGPLSVAAPGRPSWLTDGLLGALAVGPALGAVPRDVDPGRETFHAGNVSFRTAALRGAGGFWPARGHLWHGRDWFADEHETQRELGRAGWRARWAPDAEASRLLPPELRPSAVLRRRGRYGARLALVGGGRPARVAVRTAAAGLAGAAVGAARGDRATLERAARAAENLGVLLAAAVARADLQPVARSTPFRHTVPPPARGSVRVRRPRRVPGRKTALPAILLYHRIEELERDPLGLAVRPSNFAEQLEVLTGRATTLDEVAAGQARPGAVAVTFDDGYADNLHRALPALQAAGVPATLFVATGNVRTGAGFWWDTLDRLLQEAGPDRGSLSIALGADARSWPARSPGQREAARRHLHGWLQARPPEQITSALGQLGTWAGGDPHATPGRDRPLTVTELCELARAGPVALGAHTRTHRSLAASAPAIQREELAGSAEDLRRWTGERPGAVSYPFGVPGVDVDAATLAAAAQAGFRAGVVNAPGRVTARSPRLALPRLTAPDVPGEAFAAWLASGPRV